MKKLLLSLGTAVAVVTPITTVIACSSEEGYSVDDQKVINKLSKTEAQDILENQWQNKVLEGIYPGDETNPGYDSTKLFKDDTSGFKEDFVKAFKFVVTENIKSNPTYLNTLLKDIKTYASFDETFIDDASTLLNHQVFTPINGNINTTLATFSDENIGKFFFDKHTSDDDKNTFDPLSTGLKTKILKMLITKKYMSITREEWQDTNKADYFTISNELENTTISKTKYFPLIKETLSKKTAVKWTVTLDEISSAGFVNLKSPDANSYDDALNVMRNRKDATTAIPSFWDGAKTLTRNKEVLVESNPFNTLESALYGYDGLTTLTNGTDGLDFSELGLKTATKEEREGFLQEGQLIYSGWEDPSEDAIKGKPITYFAKDQNNIDVTFVKSLIPLFKADEVSISTGEANSTLKTIKINDEEVQDVAATFDTNQTSGEITYKDGTKFTSMQSVDIEYTVDASTDVKTKSINPTKNGEMEFDSDVNMDNLIYLLFQQDEGIYSDALNYYTKRTNNPVFVEVENDHIFEILWDKGLKYIKNI